MDESVAGAGNAYELVKARFAGAEPEIECGCLQNSFFRAIREDDQVCLATLERLRCAIRRGDGELGRAS